MPQTRSNILSTLFVGLVLWLGSIVPVAGAEAPVLFTLTPITTAPPSGSQPKPLTITATAGMHKSSLPGHAFSKWALRPGTALSSVQPPAPRTVEIYGGQDASQVLLCRIVVAYFRDRNGGWIPHFQLDEEPLVVYDGTQWTPLLTVRGLPSLIVQSGTALPNAEGFSPILEFGLSTGPMAIDFWIVQ